MGSHLLQVQGQYHWEVAFWRAGDAVHGSQSLPLRFSAAENRLTVSGGTFDQFAELCTSHRPLLLELFQTSWLDWLLPVTMSWICFGVVVVTFVSTSE